MAASHHLLKICGAGLLHSCSYPAYSVYNLLAYALSRAAKQPVQRNTAGALSRNVMGAPCNH
eukprot:1157545-Pelagomonas_calceolata.AAC.7